MTGICFLTGFALFGKITDELVAPLIIGKSQRSSILHGDYWIFFVSVTSIIKLNQSARKKLLNYLKKHRLQTKRFARLEAGATWVAKLRACLRPFIKRLALEQTLSIKSFHLSTHLSILLT